MADTKLTWSNSKVGYDPGQSQSLTINFENRNTKKVTVSVSYSARSLGMDSYTISQRWNKASVYIYRRDKNGNNDDLLATHTWRYQIHGNGGSSSHSDSFTFNAKNGETLFNVYYDNMRQGTNTPWYGPKSTGDTSTEYGHDKIKIGVLKVDDNVKVKVNYYTGGLKEANIKNFPADTEIYKGNDYTVSKKTPTHPYYTFRGGYDKTDSWKKKKDGTARSVNTTKPSVNSGETVKDVDSTLKLWACWSPKVYTYKFYTDESLKTELTELRQTRKYGSKQLPVPDLNPKDGVIPKGYKTGYIHKGWKHNKSSEIQYHAVGGKGCNYEGNAKSWPVWEAMKCDLVFDYGFNDYTRDFNYTFGSTFDCINACKSEDDKTVDPTNIRLGYKLVGWSFTKPDYIYPPNQAVNYNFNYDYNGVLVINESANKFPNGIILYAVWEYYTTLYVFTNNYKDNLDNIRRWKLVTPYIKHNGNWTQAIGTYAFTNLLDPEQDPDWKL